MWIIVGDRSVNICIQKCESFKSINLALWHLCQIKKFNVFTLDPLLCVTVFKTYLTLLTRFVKNLPAQMNSFHYSSYSRYKTQYVQGFWGQEKICHELYLCRGVEKLKHVTDIALVWPLRCLRLLRLFMIDRIIVPASFKLVCW